MKVSAKKISGAVARGELLSLILTETEVKSPAAFKKAVGKVIGNDKVVNNLFKRITREDFKARSNSVLAAPLDSEISGAAVVLLVGFKEEKDVFLNSQGLRKIGQTIKDASVKYNLPEVSLYSAAVSVGRDNVLSAILEGILISSYTFDKYKSNEKKTPKGINNLTILNAAINSQAVHATLVLGKAINGARDLVNLPARDCTPTAIVKQARSIAKSGKLGIKVFSKSDLRKMKADLMLSVFDGSNEEPFLIRMHYKPSGKSNRKVALVGKGVTFDSGGLSIKSGAGMFDMKCDMSGAAAVLGTMEILPQIKSKTEVIAYIPATENMIKDGSTRPGDIVRALNGKSVEILNTDAEGRLILGDALVLAEREKVDEIVDLATLTGSIVSALGGDYAGLFSTDDRLAQKLLNAAAESGERLWRMPLPPEYRDRLKSPFADMKNIGGSEAGSITASLFLKEFVAKTPWAHLDIAGPAFIESEKGYLRKGGTGYGIRTLIRYLGNPK